MGGGKTGRVCSKNIHLLCAGDLWLAVEIGLRIQGRSGWTSKWQGKYRQGAKTVQRSSNKTSLMPEDLTSRRADNARTSLYTPQFSLKSDWAVKEKKYAELTSLFESYRLFSFSAVWRWLTNELRDNTKTRIGERKRRESLIKAGHTSPFQSKKAAWDHAGAYRATRWLLMKIQRGAGCNLWNKA